MGIFNRLFGKKHKKSEEPVRQKVQPEKDVEEVAEIKNIVLTILKNPNNYDQFGKSDSVILQASGGLPRLSEEVAQNLITTLKNYSPSAIGKGMADIITSDDPLLQNRLLLGQLTRISQEASTFARKPQVYQDKHLRAITFRSDSKRVRISTITDGLDIEIKWILDKKISIKFRQSDQKVRIIYPSICIEPAEIAASLNVANFLNQGELPSPYTSQEFNKQLADSSERRKTLSVCWTELLLLHPSAAIVIDTLRSQKEFSAFGILNDLAGLIVCGNDDVRKEVAKAMWEQNVGSLDFFFNVLGNRGMKLSGILDEEGKNAALVMREHCPDSKNDYFRKKALDLFGPSVAGIKVEKKKANVKFKTRYTKPIPPFGNIGTYEVYTAPSKDDARIFLESYSISKKFFYVEVETPEGPLGKDMMGIY